MWSPARAWAWLVTLRGLRRRLFGTITALVSFVGLQFGHGLSRFVRIRPDLLTGITLVIAAVLLWFNVADIGIGDSS